MDSSPFNRSGVTRRTPPPPMTSQTPKRDQNETVEVISTPELQNWLGSIEHCLNDICTVANDGKLNSDQKLRINTMCRKVGNAIAQMTVQYQSLKQKALQNHNSLHALSEKQDLMECLTEIKQTLQETAAKPVSSNNSSFADMVKKSPNSYIRPTNLSSVAIYPSDSTKSSEDTKNMVQKIISPEEMKLQVRGVRKTRNGGVIISTETKQDIEKLKQTVQSSLAASGLKVDEPYKRKPRIIIIGVPANLSENEVYKCIYEQNLADKCLNISRDIFMTSIKLSHKSGKKDSENCNYIIEVTAEIRKALITQDRLFINWVSCPVRDFTLVTRCYKCQQYGHASKTCKAASSVCGHCGVEGHTIQECTTKTQAPKCATCLRFKKPSNHKTGDADCPARKAAELRYINSIDYEGA